jgi:L-alanine-DL-glutamate epimerase-like enolase superfamily enzyme
MPVLRASGQSTAFARELAMKITGISTILLGHPKTQPPMQRSCAVVKVESDSGPVDYDGASGNCVHSYPIVIRAIVDDGVAPNLVGRDPLDIAFFEEPCPQHDTAGLAMLAKQSPIPIATGERICTPSHDRLTSRLGCAQFHEPDACISGGLAACMEIAGNGRELGLRLIPHLGSPTAIGLAADLHWAPAGCDLVDLDVYPDLPARDDIPRDPVSSLLRMEGGMIAPPGGLDIEEASFVALPCRRGGSFVEIFPDHEAGGRHAKA